MKRTYQSGAQKRREKQQKIDEATKSSQKMTTWLSKSESNESATKTRGVYKNPICGNFV